MAVEIGASGGFGESVSLRGADAARFMDEVARPSDDARRLEHLRLSSIAYERYVCSEPISELPTRK
jgi:hypothetical protein